MSKHEGFFLTEVLLALLVAGLALVPIFALQLRSGRVVPAVSEAIRDFSMLSPFISRAQRETKNQFPKKEAILFTEKNDQEEYRYHLSLPDADSLLYKPGICLYRAERVSSSSATIYGLIFNPEAVKE